MVVVGDEYLYTTSLHNKKEGGNIPVSKQLPVLQNTY